MRVNKMNSKLLMLDIFRIEANLNYDSIKRTDSDILVRLSRTLQRKSHICIVIFVSMVHNILNLHRGCK